jgi:hypothetical protein
VSNTSIESFGANRKYKRKRSVKSAPTMTAQSDDIEYMCRITDIHAIGSTALAGSTALRSATSTTNTGFFKTRIWPTLPFIAIYVISASINFNTGSM